MDKYSTAKQIAARSYFIRKNYRTSNTPWLPFRILRPLLKLYSRAWRSFMGQVPWTSPASILIFRNILDSSMKGFEYGSGRSTRFFARHLGSLVSIEHDAGWYEKVKHDLEQPQNVTYKLIPPEGSEKEVSYHAYASAILEHPAASFDFVLVDGRARVECCRNAVGRLKPGGILVLDNSERGHYREVFDMLKNWPMVNTTTGLTDTTFWFKPQEKAWSASQI